MAQRRPWRADFRHTFKGLTTTGINDRWKMEEQR